MACGELSSLASPALGVDMELKTEAAFRHTRSFLASGHLDEVVTFSFGGCLSSSSICLTQNFSTFLEKDLIFHNEHGMQATTSARALFSSCYKANNQLNTGLVLLLLADIHKVSSFAICCKIHPCTGQRSGTPYE